MKPYADEAEKSPERRLGSVATHGSDGKSKFDVTVRAGHVPHDLVCWVGGKYNLECRPADLMQELFESQRCRQDKSRPKHGLCVGKCLSSPLGQW